MCWGVDLLPSYTEQMRFLPSLIQDSKEEYIAGVALLRQLLAVGYQVLVSHDPAERAEQILCETRNISKTFSVMRWGIDLRIDRHWNAIKSRL